MSEKVISLSACPHQTGVCQGERTDAAGGRGFRGKKLAYKSKYDGGGGGTRDERQKGRDDRERGEHGYILE